MLALVPRSLPGPLAGLPGRRNPALWGRAPPLPWMDKAENTSDIHRSKTTTSVKWIAVIVVVDGRRGRPEAPDRIADAKAEEPRGERQERAKAP